MLDPKIIVRKATGQVDDLVGEIRQVTARNERVLVTTLTKRMAESLTDYLKEMEIRVRYLHSDIQTMERMELIRDLRLGEYRRSGGYQPAARGPGSSGGCPGSDSGRGQGRLSAQRDQHDSDDRTCGAQCGRSGYYVRRRDDGEHDEGYQRDEPPPRDCRRPTTRTHGITPETVRNAVREVLEITKKVEASAPAALNEDERAALMRQIEDQMLAAAKNLEFEEAAKLRDRLLELRGEKPPVNDVQQRRKRWKRR